MKKINQIISIIITTMILLSCGEKNKENTKAENSSEEKIEAVNAEEVIEETIEEPTIEYRIGQKITEDVYESNENGLKTYLHFESSEECEGMCGSLTLSNNATDCKYVYTYSVKENKIEAEFYASDCGANASDQIFTYDEEMNIISCYINGDKFEFESIF